MNPPKFSASGSVCRRAAGGLTLRLGATRPVRIIVGFAPAGAGDIVARLIGQWLSERLGQPFVVENRPGANGNIAAQAGVRAPADGYTLLMVSSANAANAALYDKLSFNFLRDIAPVAGIIRTPYVMAVNPTVPAETIPEFIAYAKANPGKISMASVGVGSGTHLAGGRDQRARTAFKAEARRCDGVSLSARAFPPFFPPRRPRSTAAGSFVVGGSWSSTSPVAMSITSLASLLGSRGRLRCLSAMLAICARIPEIARAGQEPPHSN
jgi:Tripartite tricarboxylate transporter family receptor